MTPTLTTSPSRLSNLPSRPSEFYSYTATDKIHSTSTVLARPIASVRHFVANVRWRCGRRAPRQAVFAAALAVTLRTCSETDINCWRRRRVDNWTSGSDCSRFWKPIVQSPVMPPRAERARARARAWRECERATKLSLTDGNQTRQLMIMPLDRSRTESEKERKGRNRRTDGRTD